MTPCDRQNKNIQCHFYNKKEKALKNPCLMQNLWAQIIILILVPI